MTDLKLLKKRSQAFSGLRLHFDTLHNILVLYHLCNAFFWSSPLLQPCTSLKPSKDFLKCRPVLMALVWLPPFLCCFFLLPLTITFLLFHFSEALFGVPHIKKSPRMLQSVALLNSQEQLISKFRAQEDYMIAVSVHVLSCDNEIKNCTMAYGFALIIMWTIDALMRQWSTFNCWSHYQDNLGSQLSVWWNDNISTSPLK